MLLLIGASIKRCGDAPFLPRSRSIKNILSVPKYSLLFAHILKEGNKKYFPIIRAEFHVIQTN